MNEYAIKDLQLPLSYGYKSIISKILSSTVDIETLLAQTRISANIEFNLSDTTDPQISFIKKKINIWELSQQIGFLIIHFPYSTLQILAEIIVEYLFKFFTINNAHQPFPSIDNIHIQLEIVSSNDFLRSTTPFVSSIKAKFSSVACPLKQEQNSWGHVDIVNEFSELMNNGISVGLYVLHIKPGHSIPLHIHKIMTESEMVISHNVICQRKLIPYGCVHIWYHAPHEYSNQDSCSQSILCIDSPAFIRTDEILVEGEPATNINMVLMNSYLFDAKPVFYFPGSFLSQQQIVLTTDPSQFNLRSDAVLVFAFNVNNELLFINHRQRGWELPGGKNELNEDEIQTCIRETFEESYCELDESSLKPIAQYKVIDETGIDEEHVKSVYTARVKLEHQDCRFNYESKERKFISSPNWCMILNENYSLLLHDNVYPICLELAKHELNIL
jgi:8-oxo-dGTP diphosphatase